MDFWQGLLVLTCVHLLAAAAPAPDFAFVTRQALVYGREAQVTTGDDGREFMRVFFSERAEGKQQVFYFTDPAIAQR